MKNLSITILLTSFCGCYEISNTLNNCDAERKKKRQCQAKNLISCEFVFARSSDRNYGIDPCTNPDGFFFLLSGSCEIPEKCRGNYFGLPNSQGQ